MQNNTQSRKAAISHIIWQEMLTGCPEHFPMVVCEELAGQIIEADPLTSEAEELRAEVERLREALISASSRFPKHILTVNADTHLSDEQYQRLKRQCAENFGEGQFILLEGGVYYGGMTEVSALTGSGKEEK